MWALMPKPGREVSWLPGMWEDERDTYASTSSSHYVDFPAQVGNILVWVELVVAAEHDC